MNILKYAVSLSFLSVSLIFAAPAQECTSAALAQKPGAFRASKLSGSTTGVSAADLAREKSLLTNIHKIIAAGYSPIGIIADYSFHFDGGYDPKFQNKAADTFGYSLYLLKYNCDKSSADKSKFYIGTDTPTVVRIDANIINNFGLSASNIADNTFRGYLLMRNMPKKINGFYFLGDEFSGNSQTKQKEYTWLITYDDTFPFSYLSRREYLLLSKERLEKTIKDDSNANGFYNQYLNRINEYLKKSEAELNQPAIVNRSDEERFTGFVEEGSSNSHFAVKHNPAYYKKGLPKSAPQFFTVVYSVWEGDESAVYTDNISVIKKAVDFNALKNMLGK